MTIDRGLIDTVLLGAYFVLIDPAIYSIQHNIANLKIAGDFPKCEDAYLVDKIDSEKGN